MPALDANAEQRATAAAGATSDRRRSAATRCPAFLRSLAHFLDCVDRPGPERRGRPPGVDGADDERVEGMVIASAGGPRPWPLPAAAGCPYAWRFFLSRRLAVVAAPAGQAICLASCKASILQVVVRSKLQDQRGLPQTQILCSGNPAKEAEGWHWVGRLPSQR